MLIHVRANDITSGVNPLNSVKKIVKEGSGISPTTTVAISSIILTLYFAML